VGGGENREGISLHRNNKKGKGVPEKITSLIERTQEKVGKKNERGDNWESIGGGGEKIMSGETIVGDWEEKKEVSICGKGVCGKGKSYGKVRQGNKISNKKKKKVTQTQAKKRVVGSKNTKPKGKRGGASRGKKKGVKNYKVRRN